MENRKRVEVKIVGINGSPRKYGASFKLLSLALRFAEREGAETELIHLYDYNIKPCLGCVSDGVEYCRFPCIVKDDFNAIAGRLVEADAFILASPIYWYSVSGVMKNFIDRLTSLENMIYHEPRKSLLEGKVAGFIAVGNDTGAIMAIAWMMVVLNSMGVHVPAWALAYHHEKEVDVLDNKSAVQDAANLGIIVARAAKLLKLEKNWYIEIPEARLLPVIEDVRREAEKNSAQLRERVKKFTSL